MADLTIEQLECRLRQAAAEISYPPTPDLRGAIELPVGERARRERQARRLAWAAALLTLALLAGLLTAPGGRAAVAEFLQVGVVRVLLGPAPTAGPPPAERAPAGAYPSPTAGLPAVEFLPLRDLLGETSLEDARRRVDFPIRLPAYPPDLGAPDRVFLQDMAGSLLMLAWTEPGQPDRARLSLQIIAPGSFALRKVEPKIVRETQVNGRPAVWAEGPYLLMVDKGEMDIRWLVSGRVLIWEADGLTYRLETALPLDEAVKIAESLKE